MQPGFCHGLLAYHASRRRRAGRPRTQPAHAVPRPRARCRTLDVDLVGTSGAALPSFISGNPRITVHTILDSASRGHAARSRVGYVAAAVLRGVRLLASLTALLLWRVPRPDVILVQNPPGAPTLAVAWLAARVRSARLVVDWHNTTSAMLAMRLGASHVLVRAIGWYEGASAARPT
jgi:beta-1,4-mannosyltransferase